MVILISCRVISHRLQPKLKADVEAEGLSCQWGLQTERGPSSPGPRTQGPLFASYDISVRIIFR